jgi:hypothetical protein
MAATLIPASPACFRLAAVTDLKLLNRIDARASLAGDQRICERSDGGRGRAALEHDGAGRHGVLPALIRYLGQSWHAFYRLKA